MKFMPETEPPEEIKELFRNFKDKKGLSNEEKEEMFEWAKENVAEVRPFVTSVFDYNESQYARYIRHRKKQGYGTTGEVDTEGELESNEKDDLKNFLEGTWEDIKRIGSKAVMDWSSIASDMGYYDEEAEMLDLESFIKDAVQFYQEKSPVVDELEAKSKTNAAVALTTLEALRRAWEKFAQIQAYIQTMKKNNPQIAPLLSGLERTLPYGGEKQNVRKKREQPEYAR